MQDSLRQLVEVELVYQRGVLPQAHYTFKHALIQDTAYESLLKRTRQDLHTQIAQVLEEQFPETTQTQPEIIAHHYTEAGLQEQAFGYWQKAGDNARERTADVEAIAHFTKGLAVLKTLPDTPERVQQELTLQLALAEPLQNIKGFASSDVEHVLARAQELCQRVGETPQLFWALYGFMGIYMARAEYQTAYERSSQCLRLAELLQDPPLLLLSHKAQGACLRLLGDLPLAQEHLERALTLYDPQLQPAMAFNKAYCQGELSQVLWFLGYLDQAVVQNDATLTFARQLSHPHDLAYGLFYVAQFYIECGERQAAQELLEEVLSLSTEYGFPMLLSWATLLRGIALALQGQVEEGLAQMEQGVALENEAGGNLVRVTAAGALAGAYVATGQMEKGLALVAEGLQSARAVGMRITEARLYISKGRFLLAQSPQPLAEAESCFQRALDIARHSKAKLIQLQAAIGVSRMWQKQGRKPQAYQLLSEIYAWFSEGFDTKDLQNAKALLNTLAEGE